MFTLSRFNLLLQDPPFDNLPEIPMSTQSGANPMADEQINTTSQCSEGTMKSVLTLVDSIFDSCKMNQNNDTFVHVSIYCKQNLYTF